MTRPLLRKSLDKILIQKAQKHLKSSDAVLSGLIDRYGPCTIRPDLENPFHSLASSIISQQLSARAAMAIKGRLFDLLGTDRLSPELILRMTAKNFQGVGLSRAKSDYLQGLALAFKNGVIDFSLIRNCDDEEVIARLVNLSGIGRWTAEMFLIFGLGRPDVLSVNDTGLKRAFKLNYNLRKIPSADEMISIGKAWKPYRSVGSWYLWRTID